MTGQRVAVVGLGRLGAPMAACLASRGLRVIGVDKDAARISALLARSPSIAEPDVAELLRTSGERLSFTTDLEHAVRSSDTTIVIVATPSEPSTGRFSLRFLAPAVEEIGRALRHRTDPHLVVIASTVMPGDIDGELRPLLEASSGRECGELLGLCYWPEFIALGTFVRDFLAPELVVIGANDASTAARLRTMLDPLFTNTPSVHVTSVRNAELAKLALNAFVATKIGFANLLGRLCETMPGGDVDAVTAIVGSDSRVGSRFFRGALPFGGACFPRDVVALARLAQDSGVDPSIVEGVHASNISHLEDLAGAVAASAGDGGVAVLGLAFKPGTDVVQGSPGLELAARLARDGVPVVGWDPLAGAAARDLLPPPARVADRVDDALRDASVVVIANAIPELRGIGTLLHGTRVHTLYDGWRIADRSLLPPSIDYRGLGLGR